MAAINPQTANESILTFTDSRGRGLENTVCQQGLHNAEVIVYPSAGIAKSVADAMETI